MKNILYVICVTCLIIMTGCADRQQTAIQIGDIQISPQEFEQAYMSSGYDVMKAAGRKAFLESYISTKLILKEAEKAGLDKDPRFLSDIQQFWEKGLLKLVLSKKSKELGMDVTVSDQEINEYYRQHKSTDFPARELPEVYDQIKWILLKEKQRFVMADWVESLKDKTNIKINYDLLGIK